MYTQHKSISHTRLPVVSLNFYPGFIFGIQEREVANLEYYRSFTVRMRVYKFYQKNEKYQRFCKERIASI